MGLALTSKPRYYVYAYISTDGVPYYIGKGTGNRAYQAKHSCEVPPKERIVILEANLTDLGACAIERRLIRWYGRQRYDAGGILQNQSGGGNGGGPEAGWNHSNETKARMKAGWAKYKDSPDYVPPRNGKGNKGKAKSEEHKANIGKAHKGRVRTAEHSKAISEARKGIAVNKGIKQKTIRCEHCEKESNGGNYKRWHGDNCKLRKSMAL